MSPGPEQERHIKRWRPSLRSTNWRIEWQAFGALGNAATALLTLASGNSWSLGYGERLVKCITSSLNGQKLVVVEKVGQDQRVDGPRSPTERDPYMTLRAHHRP